MVDRDRSDSDEALARHAVHALGLVGLLAGLVLLRDTVIGGDPLAALAGLASQLGTTLPAAVLVGAATALNVGAGAVLLRLIAGRPFAGLRQAALAGLAGAVLLDVALMAALGSVGAFNWPVLTLVEGGLLLVGLRVRPILGWHVRPRLMAIELRERVGRWPLAAALVVLVWLGPATLTLASPVVPFLDVLPNQVAPVEHLRAFGTLGALDTTPSPIYGPSRIFLGYQALLGTIATTTGMGGPLAVAAFALPLLALVAAAGHGLAGAIGGRSAAAWALVLVPLSVTFLRLPDARAGVLAFPLVAYLLWLMVDPPPVSPLRRAALMAVVLASALLVHPLIGLLGAATLGIIALARPQRYGEAITVVVVALAVAVPQWAVMGGLSVPAAAALLVAPLAVALLVLMVAGGGLVSTVARAVHGAGRAALVVVAVAMLAAVVLPGGASMALARDWVGEYPVLLAGAVLGAGLAWRREGMDLLGAGMAATLLAGVAAALLPGDDPLVVAARFEVPKTLAYFAPTLLAVAAAVGLAALWRRSWPLPLRATAAAILIVAAAAPLRAGVVEDLSLGEHRLAEGLSISWRNAARGYWQGFPDSRTLIDADQAALAGALREEIAAGRLTATDEVIHVARSFQPWASTPLAVFAGVIETTATTDPERSIHTHGGRLRDVADLAALLSGRPPYVVLEPAGLPPTLRADIVAAGYEPIFANSRGEVFARAN